MSFQVALDAYAGPLDLLLYLVRREEVELAELPLARVTQQYMEYVALLEKLDVDAVGEFIDVASTLIELKSRSVLPQADDGTDEPLEPQERLVERLLEYKQARDGAAQLDRLRSAWRLRRTRRTPLGAQVEPGDVDRPLGGVELWDLVSAFARVLRERLTPTPEPATIVYDETPVHVHMLRTFERLRGAGRAVPFADLFPEGPVHKSTMIGVFLAVLELMRHGHAVATQQVRYGPIELGLGGVALDVTLYAA
ncbi:MAG: segregation and condensation protein A [Lacipirellulaceae bacterium]